MNRIIDIDAIMSAIDSAFELTMKDVGNAMTEAIESEIYDHPGITRRKNGSVVSSPRDIVDRGELRDSQSILSVGPCDSDISWNASYSSLVHGGYRTKTGKYIPPKPWTQKAIRGDALAPIEYQDPDAILDVPSTFTDHFQQVMK